MKIIAVVMGLLMVVWAADVRAQFHEMESLPWVPARPEGKTMSDGGGGAVLDELAAALQQEEYKQVVDKYYPLAISGGFQRNTNLYNQTRRALRQILQTDEGAAYWNKMEKLYHERYANIGKDEYRYRNTLETAAWCDEQLDNEQLLMLSKRVGGMEACFDRAHQILSRRQGKADPVIVLQGMFVPLNREHAAHPERGKSYVNRYSDIVRWLDVTETFMKQEHDADYQTYYNQQTLAMVRDESERQVNADASIAAFEAHRIELYYQKNDYGEAYQRVNEALAANDKMKEAHILKSNILQRAANASNKMADKVAFWCAAYEAGQGYVDRKTQRHILSALKSHLFMTGLAGQVHSTRNPFSIRQRIWTVEELREK